MKNYYWSILVHVVLFLLLIFSWKTVPVPSKDETFAITVDFSETVDQPSVMSQKVERSVSSSQQKSTPKPISKPTENIKKSPSPSASKPSAKSTPISQKSKENKVEAIATKTAEDEAAYLAAQQLEAERKQKEKEKNEKVSFFTNLLNKSKGITDSKASDDKAESNQTTKPASSASARLPEGKSSNVQGFAGSRKVIKVPVINDNSQKQGRVVVNICVNELGKVISSKYTQIGSTTADTYLVELAEKGASEYLFSPSTQSKECGRVIIEFRLRA